MKTFLRTYVVAVALAALAAASLLGALAVATIFRPSPNIVATTAGQIKTPVVVSKANVMNLLANKVTIAASVDSGPVTIAVGRSLDVDAWANQRHASVITGLKTWKTLAVTALPAPTPPTDTKASPTAPVMEEKTLNEGSDMWLVKSSGEKNLKLQYATSDTPVSLVVYGDGKTIPKVTMIWNYPRQSAWLWPLFLVGIALLIGAGICWFIWRRHLQGPDKDSAPVALAPVVLETVGEFGNRRPSRKSLREARRAGHATVLVDGVEFTTGTLPKIVMPPDTDLTLVAESATNSDGPTTARLTDQEKTQSPDTGADTIIKIERSSGADRPLVSPSRIPTRETNRTSQPRFTGRRGRWNLGGTKATELDRRTDVWTNDSDLPQSQERGQE